MEFKENLTNEYLGTKFKSQFALVNHAIKLAENMIKTGRAPRVKSDVQNSALDVIAEIATGQDSLEEIIIEVNGADSGEDLVIKAVFDDEKKSYKKESTGKKAKSSRLKVFEDLPED